MKKQNLNIPTPRQSQLQYYLKEWDKLESYRNQESALNKLFHRTYPQNNDLDEVLVKVATLNDFYSTRIMNIFAVAKHIKGISCIDERLKNGDESLVDEIANVCELGKNFYSFATKFCAHHNDADFAIFDRYVERILMHFKGDFISDSFVKKADLREYPIFKKILRDFKAHYAIEATLKELDKYIWQLGKKHFPREKHEKKGNLG